MAQVQRAGLPNADQPNIEKSDDGEQETGGAEVKARQDGGRARLGRYTFREKRLEVSRGRVAQSLAIFPVQSAIASLLYLRRRLL